VTLSRGPVLWTSDPDSHTVWQSKWDCESCLLPEPYVPAQLAKPGRLIYQASSGDGFCED